jgi:hypothetical protein
MAIGRKTGGGKKRSTNIHTTALKDMILTALSMAGGTEYLVAQAHANPVVFLALLGRVLPLTVAGDTGQPLVVEVVHIAFPPELIPPGMRLEPPTIIEAETKTLQ